MASSNHLAPVWRCEPSVDRGVFTVALDPREATFVLTRGWVLLDGVRYRASLAGCGGADVAGDGRVMVRCDIDVPGCVSHREGLAKVA